MSNMIKLVVVVGFLTTISSYSLQLPHRPKFRFDSAQAIGVDGTIEDGVIVSDKGDTQEMRDELTAQLFYMVGLLNGYSAAGDLGHIDVKVKSVVAIPGGPFSEIHYSVKMLLGWPKGQPVPMSIPLVFPRRLDEEGKLAFFKRYSKECSEDPGDEDLNLISFYYYYRPSKEGCPLFSQVDPNLAVHNTMTIRPSSANTEGKFPEYDKVWEDNTLVVTAIFGTYKEGATSNGDAGVAAYNDMYRTLRQNFGRPTYMNVWIGPMQVPGVYNPDVEMEFDLGRGYKLNANILLVDKVSLQNVTPQFAKRYNQRTTNSDFISYNGHSGFGENIRALASMGHFVKGQYQLFFVNGCDTFFYVDDSLRAAHEAVNPGSKPYEYFDVITNALPSIFQYEVNNNMAIINGLLNTRETYRQILSHFNDSSHSIVMGEEDNHWPKPFR